MKKICLPFFVMTLLLFFVSCNESEEAKMTIAKINEIGTVTLEKETLINEAEELFTNLSETDKKHVKNQNILFEARSEYNKIVANNIEKEIEQLPNVMTDDTKKLLHKYVLLSNDIRNNVKNFNKLKTIFETTPDVITNYKEYDENENLIYHKDGHNDETWYKYNDLNLCIETTSKRNGKTTIGRTTYDENNKPVKYYTSNSWGVCF